MYLHISEEESAVVGGGQESERVIERSGESLRVAGPRPYFRDRAQCLFCRWKLRVGSMRARALAYESVPAFLDSHVKRAGRFREVAGHV